MIDFNLIEKRWRKCWHVAPDIYLLLRESNSLNASRQKTMDFLHATEMSFRNDFYELTSAEFILFRHALQVLKSIFSKHHERIANTSPLEFLWRAARKGDSEVEDDFVDEFEHLFRAIKGNTQVYPSHLMEGSVSPDFEKYKGREAALRRSDYLDELGRVADHYLKKYPDGLSQEIIERRIKNKRKILRAFDANEDDWKDYRWHFRNTIKDLRGLEKLKRVIKITESQERAVTVAMKNRIPFGITPHYLHLMDEEPGSNDFAIRKQVFPSLDHSQTMLSHKNDRSITFDFMREHDTSPCENITRRYPKVAILKPVDTCPQVCVYCQRNWELRPPFNDIVKIQKKNINRTIKWIERHQQIMDLLITGGDPLIMSNQLIDDLLSQLSKIPHLKSIRIASRALATVPQRINGELLDILERYNEPGKRTIYFVTHFQHPYEICPEGVEAITNLRKKGLLIYNQQVFTFANSRRFESVALRIALKNVGIDPYYIFNMKGKSELTEYAVPVARILQEIREEARILPGIFRTDEPVFNVPFLGKNHMRAWQDHELISIRPNGKRVYAFHPWEKNIRNVDSYIYTDISIRSYLDKLKDRGEDTEEYRSIWYYY